MPNHIHMIVFMEQEEVGGSRTAPMVGRKELGRIIGAFKTITTKRINILRFMPGILFWQRSFYEYIIRDDEDLYNTRRYILENPQKWELDKENINRL